MNPSGKSSSHQGIRPETQKNEAKKEERSANEKAAVHADSPNILVVDDDPIFRALISNAAKRKHLNVTVCASLRELDPMAAPNLFDAAIVDYYLDGLKENLKGTHVALALESTPIILVSNNDHCVEAYEPWPSGIRKFVNKRSGVEAILDEATKLGRHKEQAAA